MVVLVVPEAVYVVGKVVDLRHAQSCVVLVVVLVVVVVVVVVVVTFGLKARTILLAVIV